MKIVCVFAQTYQEIKHQCTQNYLFRDTSKNYKVIWSAFSLLFFIHVPSREQQFFSNFFLILAVIAHNTIHIMSLFCDFTSIYNILWLAKETDTFPYLKTINIQVILLMYMVSYRFFVFSSYPILSSPFVYDDVTHHVDIIIAAF